MGKDGIIDMGMEKSGSPVLTQDDLNSFYQGEVSERLQNLWGFSLADLAEVVSNKLYKLQE